MSKEPIWSIGFRPFFLLGSVFGGCIIFYWAIVYFLGNLPQSYFSSVNWHAHEMVYGFSVSIIAGFLLTASANWTGTIPTHGKKLVILFLLWFLGRIAFLLSLFILPIPNWMYSLVEMLFIPSLIWVLSPPLIRAKKIINIQFLFLLLLMALGNFITHLASLKLIEEEYGIKGIYLGLYLVLLILIVISGRIVPLFTGNAIPGIKIKKINVIEKLLFISVVGFIICDLFINNTAFTAWAAFVAFLVNLFRLLSWKPWKVSSNPLIWILHLGYLWIVIGFLLIFLSDIFAFLPRSVAIHAFTAGAIGTFVIGMMSRVSLGHTGRPLKLEKGFVSSYIFITISAVVRVLSGFLPEFYFEGILVSGICWFLSFLIFVIYYIKILMTPRADQR